MSEDELKSLLIDIKNYLSITWQDENTDKNIMGIMKRGMKYLNDIAGVDNLDFKDENLERQLLFDYVRYGRSQALEVFDKNFQSSLLNLHFMYQSPLQGGQNDEDKDTE